MSNSRPRGRIPNDPEWAAIVAKAERTLPADGEFNENDNMVREWTEGVRYHGCVIHFKNHHRAHLNVWQCRFYLAGQQRVLGRGTLYQCARLYDAAVIKYAAFRSNRAAAFNFSESEAKADQCHADFVLFFGAIEDYFKPRGELIETTEVKQEHARLRVLDRQHRTRTFTGRVESRIEAVEKHLESLTQKMANVERGIGLLDGRIAILCSTLGVRTRSESAELLAEVRLHQLPAAPVVGDIHAKNKIEQQYEKIVSDAQSKFFPPAHEPRGPVGENDPRMLLDSEPGIE